MSDLGQKQTRYDSCIFLQHADGIQLDDDLYIHKTHRRFFTDNLDSNLRDLSPDQ